MEATCNWWMSLSSSDRRCSGWFKAHTQMLFLQSLLLNGLLEQSLLIHNRCTADVISHPIHQSLHSIKLNLARAPRCVIDRHIALTLCPFAVVQTWRRIDFFFWCGRVGYDQSGQRVSAHSAHNEIIWNYSQWSGSLLVRATLSSVAVLHRWEEVTANKLSVSRASS